MCLFGVVHADEDPKVVFLVEKGCSLKMVIRYESFVNAVRKKLVGGSGLATTRGEGGGGAN